ncbi:hypothetical protein SAMN05216345_105255 [Cupriavidus sp. YR651]|uniref:hypothetical protein n=1 Tax=Cupriavidus sp. YR651 TaxID=1855315 RepID=UPI000887D859|nr:hypothetical protein [Cupriavidus sp. YR651]SDD02335.1 hypothetical protein SAMN05216345_105255 [Cupriavidus sp. YR651]
MERRHFIYLAGGLGVSYAANVFAADQVGEALDGYWLVSVEGQERERLLLITGARSDAGAIRVDDAVYGWLDAGMAPVKGWTGKVDGNQLLLNFITPASSAIQVTLNAGETSLSGTFQATGKPARMVRFTKLDPAEIADLRAAAKAARLARSSPSQKPSSPAANDQVVATGGEYHASRSSRIVFLYVGSFDCPGCRGYEAEYFGRMDKMASTFPEFKAITYEKVKLGSFRAPIRADDLPESLRWAMAPQADGKPLLHTRGYPFFAAFVDDHLWAQGHGVSGLETLVLPQLRRAMAEKSAS